jgi:NAD(P)-dependent dehydrogenase (short-subunit alcohol dehydrogenase family)
VCLVTGANAGIGRETAAGLARSGASVIMVCRNALRGQRALEDVRRETGNQRVRLQLCDLSSQASIRDLARRVLGEHERLHVLINNAAVLPRRREVTVDGLERQFAVNHLAGFLLTRLLQERLRQSAPARVVNVASSAHTGATIDFEDLQAERDDHPRRVYGRTKLMNVLFTYELARRLAGSGVTANCLHPGTIATSLLGDYVGLPRLLRRLPSFFFGSPAKGARTSLHLALAGDLEEKSGLYFKDCRPVPSSQESKDEQVAARLWEVSERLAGLDRP